MRNALLPRPQAKGIKEKRMIEINKITKTFLPGTVNEKKALDCVSLSAQDSEFITVIGSNGAGKTTLFGAISGSFPLDSGRIVLDGKDITSLPEYRRSRFIGRLFQDPMAGTAPGLNVEENLSLVLLQGKKNSNAFSRITGSDRDMFTEKLAALGMGLENRLRQPVGLLSGGQRQALALLLATLYPPKLLLLDEHTAALDPESAGRIMDLTEKIARNSGATCLMITHNIRQALDTGDRTLIMSRGKIVADISGEERRDMGVSGLTELFRRTAGADYASDRILLSDDA